MKQVMESLIDSFKSFLGNTFSEEELKKNIKISNSRYGDVSFPCHKLAKKLSNQGNEVEIADWTLENLEYNTNLFKKAETKGPFINFFLDKERFTKQVLAEINEKKKDYGSLSVGKDKKIVFDYSAPNIGKPLHIGHIRSTILGDSLIKIMQKAGYSTHGINYLGDIGLHLGKVIYSYQKYLDEEALKKDPEKELLRLYVKFGKEHEKYISENKDSLEEKLQGNPEDEDLEQIDSPLMKSAKNILNKLEEKGPKVTKILNKIHESSMKGFNRIYKLLDVEFDEITGQSHFSERGKEVVQEALDKKIAEYDEETGAVIVNKLKKHGLPPKIILRSDGSAIYSTQDLGAAYSRHENFNFDKLIYVVAEEQETYFQQLFKTLELLGNKWAEDCYHLSFGMIQLEDKKMSSRKGNIIYLGDVLNESIERARNLIEYESISDKEKENIAKAVGVGAVKYMVLSVDPVKSIKFSWDRALNLNSNSSAYIQYNYARAYSLTKGKEIKSFDAKELKTEEEFGLVKKLSEYPLQIEKASQTLKPNLIANYVNDLAQIFSRFYHKIKINDTKEEESRLYLVKCFETVLEDSLGLLGIEVPKRM